MSTCSLLHYNPDCNFNEASRSHKTKVVEDEWRRKPRGSGFRRSRRVAAKLQVQNLAAHSSHERVLNPPKEMMRPGELVHMRTIQGEVLTGCYQLNLDAICC
jgi:hypothetical protein